jgi:hypothetical protein
MGCQDAAVQVSHNATTEAYLTFSPDGAWLGMVVSASSEVRTVERCQRHYDPSQPPDFNCGLLDVLANLNGDIYVLNVDQALAGAGETALTRITNLGFASWGFRDQDNPTLFEAFNPTWQPAPGVTP